MASVTREEMLEYLQRYQAVEEFIRTERRHIPIEVRWKQTVVLADFIKTLPHNTVQREQEEAEVRKRWAQLRAAYGESSEPS